MRVAHSVAKVREAEEALMARLPEGALMQRAAAGLAAVCARLLRESGRVRGRVVVVLAGSGGNGGDALYAGARLAGRGAEVHAVLTAPKRAHPGGLAALRAAGGRVAELGDVDGAAAAALLGRAELVLDGIVGIGGRGGLRDEVMPLVRVLRGVRRPLVVAVDVPSGVDADTGAVVPETAAAGPDGEPAGLGARAVRADVTVTFGTGKPGLFVDPGAQHAGAVELVDIGLEPWLGAADLLIPQHADVARRLRGIAPRPESDKYRRGVVGIAAGSARYPGAALLSVAGAARGGAGAVRYAGAAAREVVRAHPETLVSDGLPGGAGRVQAWVVGPGLSRDEHAARIVDDVLALEAVLPKLFDADALALVAERGPQVLRGRHPNALLTPHAGEAARLLGEGWSAARVEAERIAAVRELAGRYGVAVLLKGSTTLLAAPGDGPVHVNPTGTGWLATAGSGDVLAGLAGAQLAAGGSALGAGATAAYLHGLAGRRAAFGDGAVGAPITAGDVAAALPEVWRQVVSSGASDGV
ncbi:NAD(P)H-hydrate dehydratase [Mangrovactinospora gilvigrisea]|uniref:Bifunctional NAD(P)H-hydrate repair enzyme n=1 Tax=Mangrovactinospora gilvigrisea TaxID=1428644 RepID=A0A1J7BKQ8_9ACTN|nr:NAD(P)H-hydrate dehydratase [Mangrovactinospora gilvigrisea]OIV39238.1 NAD(P)H-hydrate dehydratase [Mangrovactinospora gilvigrisea]